MSMKLTITSLLLSCFLFANAQHHHPETPKITVQGSAVLFANPDEVLISVTVYKKDEVSASNARAAYQKQSKEVIAFLKANGIAEQHIQTQYAAVGPVRKRHSNELDYYYASQNINICIRDLNTYDAIVNGLVDMDVHKVGQANFRSDDIVELRAKASRLAMRNAKEKAEMLTNEIGQTIGKAILINESQNQRTSFNAETYGSSVVSTSASTVGEAQGFAPGQMEIKSVVNVSFELK